MYARIDERAIRTKPPLPTIGTKTLFSPTIPFLKPRKMQQQPLPSQLEITTLRNDGLKHWKQKKR